MPNINLMDHPDLLQMRYNCWLKHKGKTKQTAQELHLSESSLRHSLAKAREHPDVNTTNPDLGEEEDYSPVPPILDGYKLKGTSTFFDAQTGEPIRQWVKTEADKERQRELFLAMVEELVADLPKVPPIVAPDGYADDLLACYPVGDHHIGMFSWGEEAGEDYDLKIAETLLLRAMDYLLNATPACKYALIPILGDFTHIDNHDAVTPLNKHRLDSDTRFQKIARVALRTARYLVESAAAKHDRVRVIVIPGNHDPAVSVFLMEALHNIYEGNERIEVDTSPSMFHYFDFGKCLIGTYHGHKVKPDRLPLIMANDQPDLWGKTKFRYWLTGHIHHDSVRDYGGCRVESIRVLAAQDAWATGDGYRSMREMKAIVYHRDHGRQSQHIVNPGMLE